jgi:lysyl-tRNA synthetase class 2
VSQELDQMRVRREKMDELKAAGIEPFGRRYHRDHLAQDLHEQFDQVDKDELLEQENMVSIAGRMMRKRSSGKAGFADFVDRSTRARIWLAMNNTISLSGPILATSWESKVTSSRPTPVN